MQERAAASLEYPWLHAGQDVPLRGAERPASHALQVAFAALLLPRGPPEPAGHGTPVHEERAPAAVACIPLGHFAHE
jgi:hypothetical protein